jgi:transposase
LAPYPPGLARGRQRKRVGRNPEPSAAILDSQSVKTTEESAHPSGYDPHKKVGGRKRHLLVDTMGLPLSICVTPANVRDQHGARLLLIGRKLLMPRLKKIWADGAYDLAWLKSWCKKEGSWELEIVERDLQSKGFKVLPRRWVVERTFGWLSRNRRLAKDYERRVQTSEILIEVATIRLLLRRLARAA